MKKVLVIAPHPDDETLGCGGTLLKHKQKGDEIHWITVTGISVEQGFLEESVVKREKELSEVAEAYGFNSVHHLRFPTMFLDTLPMGKLVQCIGDVFKKIEPEVIYIPYRGDIHTDHSVVFDAAASCTKWFRYPSIKKVLAYETLSETEFGLNPDSNSFRPNVFVNIERFIEKKITIMGLFESEFSDFPFPRSKKGIESLAAFRGVSSGCEAAEAFLLLKEII